MEFIAVGLTALALVVAWAVFRLERAASAKRDVATARATLQAVQRGMVEGLPELGYAYTGWGDLYFRTEYTGATALEAGLQARRLVENGGSYQVFVVPTEPIAQLATAASHGGLISERTIFAANFALWRVRVFNQLVDRQSAFNIQHATEIQDDALPDERRKAIALAAQELNVALHLDGIGLAAREGGWYYELTTAVADNLDVLDEQSWSLRRYLTEWHLVVGDLLVIGLTAAVLASAVAMAWDSGSDPQPVTTTVEHAPQVRPLPGETQTVP